MSLEVEREHTVQLLCRQFAHDHLTTQELESRLEAVYRAASNEELRALVAGLPLVPMSAGDVQAPRGAVLHPGTSREGRVLSVLSTVKKRGAWTPAARTRAVAVLGELELDFREARIPPGVTEISITAVLAEVRIIIPPGLRVESDGTAVLGQFTGQDPLAGAPDSEAPLLRITGVAVLSEVKVRMRLPDETGLQAWKREWRR